MNLPEKFIEEIKGIIPDEYDAFLAAIEGDASVSVRLNDAKSGAQPADLKRVAWCERGYYLNSRAPFTFDPAFHAGAYYVQDASSMIIQHIVSILCKEPVRYLDLCAAPGGKSTATIDALPLGSLLVSNEMIGGRAQILKENIIKWGLPNCVVTNNDSKSIGRLSHYFDVIATDVPCSGEGMFRKEDEAVLQWTPALVAQCAMRQREIIDNIWDALRPGGYFIYSTCTYNRDENEDMIDYIVSNCDAESIDMHFPAEWNIHSGVDTQHNCYRFMPHRTDGEGLFVCVLRKGVSDPLQSRDRFLKNKLKSKKQNSKAIVPKDIKQWILNPECYEFVVDNDAVVAVPKNHIDDIEMLRRELRVIHYGIPLATLKGDNAIPAHALALSVALHADSFPIADIDYNTAIAYLRGEAIVLPAGRGNTLLSYDGRYIGFVKNLGSRANNLYPREWRIRSSYSPVEPPCVIK